MTSNDASASLRAKKDDIYLVTLISSESIFYQMVLNDASASLRAKKDDIYSVNINIVRIQFSSNDTAASLQAEKTIFIW